MLNSVESKSMNGRIAEEKFQEADRDDDDGYMDRLLLARSELSASINQIDEILAKELDHSRESKISNDDIESLINFLSGLNSSLEPWVSRLSQVRFSSTRSPQKIHASTDQDRNCSPDMIISPSPLVSWRAGGGGGFVTGRPLFLVTPLSKPSERILSLCPESSKLGVRNFSMKETNEEALQLSPSVIVSRNGGNLPEIVKKSNMSETRIKMSVSIEPPPLFNFSEAYSGMGGGSDDTSSLSPHHNSTIGRRDSGEGLEWFLSPPKTCALMDPDDGPKIAEDKSSSSSIPTISISASMDSPSPQELHDFAGKRYDEALEWFLSPPKTCALMEPLEGKAQSTPVPSESALKNPRPGENTLKKELWTKFQAVSMGRMSYTHSVPQEAPKKDFLDLLEEVSF
ncbi:hypothetical protein KSP39_PZI007571 [Platanthera zijinensis]|uniref:Uncharacterized protein n=1 Tax=Platanthera zijinensis TaxID=2320716 RepID=A0AAP0BNA0_9ASPA